MVEGWGVLNREGKEIERKRGGERERERERRLGRKPEREANCRDTGSD